MSVRKERRKKTIRYSLAKSIFDFHFYLCNVISVLFIYTGYRIHAEISYLRAIQAIINLI